MAASTPSRSLNLLIPARGGSKAIPRKNMQMLGGLPLIGHTIRAALDAALPGGVFVTSEDEEILGWSRLYGAQTIERPAEIADDATPLADVAAHHCREYGWEGVVGILQPTSPLRSADSIGRAWHQFQDSGASSLGSVVRESHNLWHSKSGAHEDAAPIFSSRVNRQLQTEALFRENGAIQFVEVDHLLATGRMISPRHILFELPEDEGLDIDLPADLLLARQLMRRGIVVLRVRANKKVGSGHLYRSIQLAQNLAHYDLVFSLVDCDPFAAEKLDALGYAWEEATNERALLERFTDHDRRLVINDVLDTSVAEIATQRSLGFRVVCIEDLGEGAGLADWVVNALYSPATEAPPTAVSGARYATLRPEFAGLPDREIRQVPRRVLVTFGGTDPGHLSSRVTDCLADLDDIALRVILGPGVAEQEFAEGCEVVRVTQSMAAEMTDADLVITSAGRTVFEAAATGTPVVVIAQNVREATHSHLDYEFGVIFLGLASLVEDSAIRSTTTRLLADPDLRAELSRRLRSSIDTRGLDRITLRIEELLEETT